MNENDNRQENLFSGDFSESAAQDSQQDRQVVNAEQEPSVPESSDRVTFDFPRPPVNSYEAPRENFYSSSSENEGFNPYAASGTDRNQNNGGYVQPTVNPQQNNYSYYNSNTSNSSYNQNRSQQQTIIDVEPEKKKGKGKKGAGIIIALCLVFALVIGLGSLFDDEDQPGTSVEASTTSASATSQPQVATTAAGSVDSYTSVVVAEKVRKSVVGILVYESGELAGEGSGVLWTENGTDTYIITCAHVIEGSGVTYGVLLLDGTYYEAEFVGADTRTDIGVLKIEATGLPLAEMGDSDSLKIGEPVYAIGNPGGSTYFGSMTDGIISSIDRSITSTYTMTVIQHNAAINPGNSGGALVNTSGQIVGINSSKIIDTDYEGMGFAVPSSIAVPVAQSLIQFGYVPNRPKLGIEYAAASSYQIYSMVVSIKGLPQGSLVIAGISEDSSLKNTEAEVGDLIIAVNGKDMDDSSVLLDLIETGAVGDTLTLTLCRIENRTYKTSTFDVTITLVEDKGSTAEETTEPVTEYNDGYYYGGSSSFEDFFNDYFGW